MKILYDYQAFALQQFGGVSRYFCELIKNIGYGNIEWELPIKHSNNEYLLELPLYEKNLIKSSNYYDDFLNGINFKGKWSLYRFRNTLFPFFDKSIVNRNFSREVLFKNNFDVFHPTYYDDYFLKCIGNKPFVVTVYDMIHEKYPHYFISHDTSAKKKAVIEKASKVIAISENTKKDIIEIYNIPKDKIEVIYLANSLDKQVFQEKVNINLPGQYLLYVGTRHTYKNFIFFLNAISTLLQDYPDLYIVCTGHPFTADEIQLFEVLNIQNKLRYIATDNRLLIHLYENALAFVFPSLYEGFGLPILEAFYCGCPAILSNTSSLPEVGGVAGVYFDPQDKTSIREAIASVIQDTQLRNSMIQKGYEQLEKFSWKQTAYLTQKLYQELL